MLDFMRPPPLTEKKKSPLFQGGSPVLRGLSTSAYSSSKSWQPCQPSGDQPEGKLVKWLLLFLLGRFLLLHRSRLCGSFSPFPSNWHRYLLFL